MTMKRIQIKNVSTEKTTLKGSQLNVLFCTSLQNEQVSFLQNGLYECVHPLL